MTYLTKLEKAIIRYGLDGVPCEEFNYEWRRPSENAKSKLNKTY